MKFQRYVGNKVILLWLLLFQIGLLLFFMHNKSGYFIDEYLTFGYASYEEPVLYPFVINSKDVNPEDINPHLKLHTNQWIDRRYFHDYLTIQEEDKFAYNQVYNNHKQDAHPPLYTFIINFFCSFFPNQFNPWCGYFVNLIAFIVVQILVFKISKCFFASNIAWLPCFFYGFTLASVNTYLYLRMYALVTVFYLFSIYLHIMYLEKQTSKLLFFMYFSALLGFLTNNHFYIFHFFLSVNMCVFLYKKLGFKSMVKYGSTIVFAVITAFVYFPSAIFQMFCFGRGEEAVSAIDKIILPDNAYLFIDIILKHVLGFPKSIINIVTNLITFVYVLIFFITVPVLFIIYIFKRNDLIQKLNKNCLNIFSYDVYKYFIIVVPVICFIQIITPMVEKYINFCGERWYFPIIPLFCVLFVKILVKIVSHNFASKTALIYTLLLCVLFAVCTYFNNTEEFTVNKTSQRNMEKLKSDIVGSNCIFFFVEDQFIHTFCDLLMNCDHAYAARDSMADLYKLKKNLQNVSNERQLLLIISENIFLENDQKIDSYSSFIIDFITNETDYNPVFKYEVMNHTEPYKVYKLVKTDR